MTFFKVLTKQYLLPAVFDECDDQDLSSSRNRVHKLKKKKKCSYQRIIIIHNYHHNFYEW